MASQQVPMQTVVETDKIPNNFDQLLHRVRDGKEYLMLKESGHDLAVVIGIKEYEEFRRWRAKKIHQQLGRELSAEFARMGITNEEQLAELMEEDRKAVYEEYYGKKD